MRDRAPAAALVFVIVFALAVLPGCSWMLENEYSSVSAHADSTPAPPSTSGTRQASNYKELKDAVLLLLRSGAEEGTVRLRNYIGDAEKDVNEACLDISRSEPIAVYALDYLAPSVTRLLSEYEVSFRLYYKRTPEQIRAVEYIIGPTALRERLAGLLYEFGTSLTFETGYYQESVYDFGAMLSELYYGEPLYAQGMPELSYMVYPESGLRRVVEVSLNYPDTLDALRAHAAQCEDAVRDMLADMPGGLAPPERALWLYGALGAACEFDWELYRALADGVYAGSSAYDALCKGRALPEGFALAYKALCDQAGIGCRVVRGRGVRPAQMPDGAPEGTAMAASAAHFWNLVELGGHFYHVDLSSDAMNDALTYRTFLLDDSVMSLEYAWDGASLPAAGGPLSEEKPVVPETAGEPGDAGEAADPGEPGKAADPGEPGELEEPGEQGVQGEPEESGEQAETLV